MRFFLFFWLLIGATALAAQSLTDSTALAEWREKWDNSLAYSLELLEKIPAEQLDFRPTPDQMSIRQQYQHIAGNMFTLSRRFLEQPMDAAAHSSLQERLQNQEASLTDIAQLLREAHAFAHEAVAALSEAALEEKVDFFAGPKTRRQILWVLQDHATHHRAQLIVYARLLGLTPPRYSGW